MNTLEKIEVLEAKLATATDARPGTVEAIVKREAEAQEMLSAFYSNPATAQLDRAFKAHATVTAAQALLAGLGESRAWADRVQSEWTREHHAELCDLLAALIQERCVVREAYLESTAVELGTLTTQLARADAGNAPDGTLTLLNDALAAVEDARQDRENRLHAAHDALRSFKTAVARPDGGYVSVYRMWQNARDAAASVDFEPAQAAP